MATKQVPGNIDERTLRELAVYYSYSPSGFWYYYKCRMPRADNLLLFVLVTDLFFLWPLPSWLRIPNSDSLLAAGYFYASAATA